MKTVKVMSTPRSGTTFLSYQLQELGLDVGHEQYGNDGTVSGFTFIDHGWYPYGYYQADKQEYDLSVRLIRDPLAVIPSLANLFRYRYTQLEPWYAGLNAVHNLGIYITEDTDDMDELLKTATSVWSATHDYIPREISVIRLENITEDLPSLLEWMEFDYESIPWIPIPNASFNNKNIDWETLSKLDSDITERAFYLSREFGYDT